MLAIDNIDTIDVDLSYAIFFWRNYNRKEVKKKWISCKYLKMQSLVRLDS